MNAAAALPATTDGSTARVQRQRDLDARGRTPAWAMRTAYRLYDAWCQPIFERENITISHWLYLRVLAERGELNQLELGKRVAVPATTAVTALDSLERRSLVKRTRDPHGRRKYYISLTDNGRELLARLLPRHSGRLR